MTNKLRGRVHVWHLAGEPREYIVLTANYGQARRLFQPDLFRVTTGQGEQRAIVPAHVRKLRKEMDSGDYTPTPVSAGLRPRHVNNLTFEGEGPTRTATLLVEPGDPLPLIDGGHRLHVLEDLRKEAEQACKDPQTREEGERTLARLDAVPITTVIHLGGNTQVDFLNLQKGKAVDASHVFSLKVCSGGGEENRDVKLAYDVAKLLNDNPDSVFHRMVRFSSSSQAACPVSTLCSKGSSDLASSLLGLVRAGEGRSAEWLAFQVVTACKCVEKEAPDLLEEGMLLTPPPNGCRGSYTMLVGLAVALAFRLKLTGEDIASERDRAQLVEAARTALAHGVGGNFSGPVKRRLLGEFAREFFGDMLHLEKHHGIPVGLIKALSASAFGVPPLPRRSRPAESPAESSEEAEAVPATSAARVTSPSDMARAAEDCSVQLSEPPEEATPKPTTYDAVVVPSSMWYSLSLEETKSLPVSELAARDAVLCLWTHPERLPDALAALRAWGFQYERTLIWVQSPGQKSGTLWGEAEHCLFGVRGNPNINLGSTPEALWQRGVRDLSGLTPFYQLVESFCPGPKVELSSDEREGWTTLLPEDICAETGPGG
jgi:N6-adenosine-specific RNA methylase IME4